MKLKELFENEFQNKGHASVEDEIDYLETITLVLNKEYDVLLKGNWDVELNKYHSKFCNRVGFHNLLSNAWRKSPEYQEFCKSPVCIKLNKIHNRIKQNNEQILQTKNKL